MRKYNLKDMIEIKNKALEIIGLSDNKNNKDEKPKTIKPVKDIPTWPKLVIDSLVLQVAIAQWLGILSNSKRQGTSSFALISHLDASELIKRSPFFVDSNIKRIDLKTAIIRFANLLSMTEIKESDTCILDNFNEENLTFDCTLQSTGEVIKMSLLYGNIDDLPEIRMTGDKKYRRYEYHYPYDDKDERIELSSYANQLGENGLQFNRYVSKYTYYGHLTDNDNKLDIEIGYPNSLDEATNNIYIDEELLEMHLNTLPFPIEVDDACRAVAASLKVSPSELKYINIVISKKQENGKFKNSQIANFRDGEMTRFWIEKDGKVIDITNFGLWKHSNEQYTVAENEDKEMSFECKNISLDSIEQSFKPIEAIKEAQKEVEEVRRLAKTILNKK